MDDVLSVFVKIFLVGVALTGGSLYAFSTFIMSALKRLPDPEGIRAMQQINITVFSPFFMVPFFASALFSIGALVVALSHTEDSWWLPLLCAGTCYGLGLFLVTAIGNVPLNNRLAQVDADEAASADFWREYQRRWCNLNHVRSASAVAAVILLAQTLWIMG